MVLALVFHIAVVITVITTMTHQIVKVARKIALIVFLTSQEEMLNVFLTIATMAMCTMII